MLNLFSVYRHHNLRKLHLMEAARTVQPPLCKYTINRIIQKRQIGLQRHMGYEDDIISKLYSKIDKFQLEGYKNPGDKRGGIFNLEFSLDGYVTHLHSILNQKCHSEGDYYWLHVKKNVY